MKDKPFNFHGAKFTVKVLTSETNGNYTVIDIFHLPNLGPALHRHPKGSESFYVVEGEYGFTLEGNIIKGKKGDVVHVPLGAAHKFIEGPEGGHAIVVSPPGLEFYFYKVSELLNDGVVSYEVESEIGQQYGQVFLNQTGHWE